MITIVMIMIMIIKVGRVGCWLVWGAESAGGRREEHCEHEGGAIFPHRVLRHRLVLSLFLSLTLSLSRSVFVCVSVSSTEVNDFAAETACSLRHCALLSPIAHLFTVYHCSGDKNTIFNQTGSFVFVFFSIITAVCVYVFKNCVRLTKKWFAYM